MRRIMTAVLCLMAVGCQTAQPRTQQTDQPTTPPPATAQSDFVRSPLQLPAPAGPVSSTKKSAPFRVASSRGQLPDYLQLADEDTAAGSAKPETPSFEELEQRAELVESRVDELVLRLEDIQAKNDTPQADDSDSNELPVIVPGPLSKPAPAFPEWAYR